MGDDEVYFVKLYAALRSAILQSPPLFLGGGLFNCQLLMVNDDCVRLEYFLTAENAEESAETAEVLKIACFNVGLCLIQICN